MQAQGTSSRGADAPFVVRVAVNAVGQLQDSQEVYKTLTDPAVLEALTAIDKPDLFAGLISEVEMAARAAKCVTQVKRVLSVVRQARVRRLRDKNANVSKLSELPPGIGEQLKTGRYRLTDEGVTAVDIDRDGNEVEVVLCYQPVAVTGFLENVEDGGRSAILAWHKSGWRTHAVDRNVLASRASLPGLARLGLLVSSENAARMVDYLTTLEAQNEGMIPCKKGISRLGWLGTDFAPYAEDICYDGDEGYRSLYEAVCAGGDYDQWLACARAIWARGGLARVFLAASFAAPLLEPLGCLSFLVHLWGKTGGGKTVALMLAASVWGDPGEGRLIRPLSGTAVGLELTAAFLRNLPMCLDELQSARDRNDFGQMIYMLTEGIGKPRGDRTGGVRRTGSWRTAILTTGEQEITDLFSAAGAVNRVLGLEIREDLFDNARQVADTVRAHFGHAGRVFIERVRETGFDELKRRHKACAERLAARGDYAGKQVQNAAAVLLADELASEWIFGTAPLDETALTRHMATVDQVDSFGRAYDFVCGWVAGNRFRFDEGRDGVELWGKTVPGGVAVIGATLALALEKMGFSYGAFLAGAEERGILLDKDHDGKRTKPVRFGGRLIRCAVIALEPPPPKEPVNEQLQFWLDVGASADDV